MLTLVPKDQMGVIRLLIQLLLLEVEEEVLMGLLLVGMVLPVVEPHLVLVQMHLVEHQLPTGLMEVVPQEEEPEVEQEEVEPQKMVMMNLVIVMVQMEEEVQLHLMVL